MTYLSKGVYCATQRNGVKFFWNFDIALWILVISYTFILAGIFLPGVCFSTWWLCICGLWVIMIKEIVDLLIERWLLCATFEEILLLRNSTCLYYFFLNYTHLKSVDFEWFWYLYGIYRFHIMLDWVSRARVYGYEEECGAPLISRDHNLTPSVLKYWGPYKVLEG